MKNLQEVIDIGEWLVYVEQMMFTVRYTCVHPAYRTIVLQASDRVKESWLEEQIEKQKSL